MPYKTKRGCPICKTLINDLSSHLRLHHKLSVMERKQFLLKSQKLNDKHQTCLDFLKTFENHSMVDEKIDGDEMTSDKAEKYVFLLNQFNCMNTLKKREYLRYRAPDSFIFVLRECVMNLMNGNIETHIDVSRCEFLCRRICDRKVNDKTVRIFLHDRRLLDLLTKLCPEVIKYLKLFYL